MKETPDCERASDLIAFLYGEADEREARDFRFCPNCKRRLLALGSPACSYCGRALPEDFVKAREQMWQRVKDVSAGRADEDEREALENESDDAMRRALKALFDLDGK